MSEPDFYAVLGVAPDADPQSIRAAYRRAAREHHPDRGGSAQTFHQVQSAWDVLGSPEARADYDRRRRSPGSAPEPDSPADTGEGAGFTYSRSAASTGSAQNSAETRTRRRPETRSASADQPPVYKPPLSTPEPLNLTLTSQKIHGGFASRGLLSGRSRRRQLRTSALLEKHVLSALPAARLFNDVALTAPGTDRAGRSRIPKSAPRVDHVLLCGPALVLVSAQEVPAATASWDGRTLRAGGKSVTLPDLAAEATQLQTSLEQQLRSEPGERSVLETDWQHILLAADGDLFHPVVQAQGAGRRGPAPLAAGRAIGHLVNVLAASQKANLVDRHLMAALRTRLAAPEEG
ncbi:J domain-containing protein [Nesterenkonia muleiensis]|uniref:J domain-containing protein n=1 Tax=Nesterenkonia muleiensis TaxID=2282648 RepID=UPI000E760D48|nr:J domain-containing protein [Nesterenkonia muleiensis]